MSSSTSSTSNSKRKIMARATQSKSKPAKLGEDQRRRRRRSKEEEESHLVQFAYFACAGPYRGKFNRPSNQNMLCLLCYCQNVAEMEGGKLGIVMQFFFYSILDRCIAFYSILDRYPSVAGFQGINVEEVFEIIPLMQSFFSGVTRLGCDMLHLQEARTSYPNSRRWSS